MKFYLTKWGQLHRSDDVIMFYHIVPSFSYGFSKSTSVGTESTGILFRCTNHLDLVSTIFFFVIGVIPTLSNVYISNPVMSSFTTHPTQHPILY